ncbi:cysteinyl leukotriene receptor 1-like [Kryptolebias marmoratus]|uniref:cysteinyl leukotriene receptor 1-like n=1 Tax=Kryptolebias marmoratus TaxID=37003 RepID=UPI0007F8DDC2|nr:cysteinyl leukotriene receptor 1-like [Kryptolebias marmoratus]
MINLAVSDWAFSLTLPLRLVYYFRDGRWDFPDWLCRVCVFGFYVNLYSSILLFTFLSVLRWIAVVHPMKHQTWKTSTRSTVAVCLLIWGFVGVSSVPFLSNGVFERNGIPRCFEPKNLSSWNKILILNYVGLVFGFLTPFLTIICCYSHIIQHLTHPKGLAASTLNRQRNNRHSIHLITMVIVTFLLCFLPYHLIRTLHLHAMNRGWSCDITQTLQRAVSVTLCLATTNSMINPLLYYYSTKTFRKDFQSTIRSSRLSSLRRNSSSSNRYGSVKRKSSQKGHLDQDQVQQTGLLWVPLCKVQQMAFRPKSIQNPPKTST